MIEAVSVSGSFIVAFDGYDSKEEVAPGEAVRPRMEVEEEGSYKGGWAQAGGEYAPSCAAQLRQQGPAPQRAAAQAVAAREQRAQAPAGVQWLGPPPVPQACRRPSGERWTRRRCCKRCPSGWRSSRQVRRSVFACCGALQH